MMKRYLGIQVRNCILNPIGRSGAQKIYWWVHYIARSNERIIERVCVKRKNVNSVWRQILSSKKYAVDTSELTDGNKLKYTTADKNGI